MKTMTLKQARALVAVSYVLALVAAWACLPFVAGYPVLVQVLIADVIATAVIFAFSVGFKNSSFYDAYWSVIPIAIAGYFLWLPGDADAVRQVLVCTVVVLWGVRLTVNWAYGWTGLDHVDWRYVNLESLAGRLWWPLSFLGVHLFPTIVVFLGCIPLYAALTTGAQPLNWIDGAAFGVGLLSVWIEYQADVELHRFRATRSSRQEVLNTGLWRWCRHPNYLGEIGFWLSVFLFGYAATGVVDAWHVSGIISMALLFLIVSIPMIENKLLEDKPDYALYRQQTFALIPLSPLFKTR